jgi:hypothetical protein
MRPSVPSSNHSCRISALPRYWFERYARVSHSASFRYPRARLRQQQRAKGLVALGVVGQPDVAAEDRLDPVRARRLVELDEAERVREIGDRERRHRVGRRSRDRVGDAQRSVGDREFAVQAQVTKAGASWTDRTDAAILRLRATGLRSRARSIRR